MCRETHSVEAARLREALREVQWCDNGKCPRCGRTPDWGHMDWCAIGKALNPSDAERALAWARGRCRACANAGSRGEPCDSCIHWGSGQGGKDNWVPAWERES